MVCDGLRKYYQYDLDAGNELPYEHDYVDMLKDKDVEMTIFIGDTRFVTSALNEKGERNEGTQMDPKIWEKVKAGQDVNADNVIIGGKPYYVYYMPLRDNSGQVVGAAWAGQPEVDVRASINSVILTMVLVFIVAIVIFAVIIVIVARRVVGSISTVISSVVALSDGDLSHNEQATSAIREIDDIGSNVFGLSNKLKEIVGDVKNASTQETGASMEELNATVNGLAAAADNLNNVASRLDDELGFFKI